MTGKTLAIVLAGGEGRRLRPLTRNEAKPALQFAQDHRIVDFVLGNLVNSEVTSIYLLGQYKPASLLQHVSDCWANWFNRSGRVVEVLLPGMDGRNEPFTGTADAVRRNLHLIERHQPEVVAVFAADHVYRMDVREMLRFHREREADVTVAAVPVPLGVAAEFGVIVADARGNIERFEEKPSNPRPMAADPGRAYASMGNYLFKPQVLIELLAETARRGGTDIGRDVMPHLAANACRALAYDFSTNAVPGIKSYEERAYWRDVGTLRSLSLARRDIEGPTPRFDLRNPQWPLHSRRNVHSPFGAAQAPRFEPQRIRSDAILAVAPAQG